MHFAAPVQHWYTNGTIIGITGVAVGVVAIVVAIVLWRFGAPRGLLEYSMPVSKALVSRSPRLRDDDLQVTLRGKAVEDPYLATLCIANHGHRDIRSDDFDQGHPLVLHLDAKVLDILSSSRSDKRLFEFKDDQLSLSPMMIRRGQQIITDVLTEGKPTLSCNAELADVKIRLQRDSDNTPISGILAALAVISLLAFSLFASNISTTDRVIGLTVFTVGAILVIWNNYQLFRKLFYPRPAMRNRSNLTSRSGH